MKSDLIALEIPSINRIYLKWRQNWISVFQCQNGLKYSMQKVQANTSLHQRKHSCNSLYQIKAARIKLYGPAALWTDQSDQQFFLDMAEEHVEIMHELFTRIRMLFFFVTEGTRTLFHRRAENCDFGTGQKNLTPAHNIDRFKNVHRSGKAASWKRYDTSGVPNI